LTATLSGFGTADWYAFVGMVDQSFQTYPSCYAMCELKIAAWAGNTAKLSNERSHKPKQQWASKDEF